VWHNILGGAPSQPSRAFPGQKMVFMSLESGRYYSMVYDAKEQGYDFLVDYRIWPDHPRGPADIPAVYMLNPTMDAFTLDFRKPPQLPKRKEGALVAAFISNCSPLNRRSELLQELIDAGVLDSYGSCHHSKDEPPRDGTMASRLAAKIKLAGEYPFILTAENSDEPGYVTEKVYQGLEVGSVPIYLGAPDVDRFVPHPSSIINAADFNVEVN
jgi:hypothetical protein